MSDQEQPVPYLVKELVPRMIKNSEDCYVKRQHQTFPIQAKKPGTLPHDRKAGGNKI